MGEHYYVYVLTNKPFGTLYVGVTNDLDRRVFEHREKVLKGFSARYGLSMLVYYEAHSTVEAAIAREKQIKKWRRDWKLQLVEALNPTWTDLYGEV